MQLNKLSALSGWQVYGLSFLCGAALALGQAPFNFPWTLFLAVPALFLMITDRSARGAFSIGWFAGLGYFAVSLHWIVEPFLVDLQRTGWMAPFALLFLSGGLALFWAVPFAISRRLSGGILAFAGLWTLGEFARSTVLTGFPWALIAYGWVETPIIQGSAFIGSHGLGFALLLLALLPAFWRWKGFGITLAVLAVAWFTLPMRMSEVTNTDTVVRLVQPNAPQHLKWHPEYVRKFFERQIDSTRAEGEVDLVIWPEAAVPYLIGTRPEVNALIADAARPAKVILGATREEGGSLFNSAVVLDEAGQLEHVYDKHHLVPFGEFLPFPSFFEQFGLQALAKNAGRFSRGAGPQKISLDATSSFQLLICYEAIFPAEILRGENRPNWLLHMTNDAWFGDFSGPFQHLAQARVRSVEYGLPLARSANTGVSAMIDPYGRITAQLDLNTDGFMDANLPKALEPTLYARLGDLPVLVGMLLLMGLGVASGRRSKAILNQNT